MPSTMPPHPLLLRPPRPDKKCPNRKHDNDRAGFCRLIVSMTTIELGSADAALMREGFLGPVMAGFFGVSGQVYARPHVVKVHIRGSAAPRRIV